ncbi:hypothetical protein CLF_109641, partial [Clonorchis sinensis]
VAVVMLGWASDGAADRFSSGVEIKSGTVKEGRWLAWPEDARSKTLLSLLVQLRRRSRTSLNNVIPNPMSGRLVLYGSSHGPQTEKQPKSSRPRATHTTFSLPMFRDSGFPEFKLLTSYMHAEYEGWDTVRVPRATQESRCGNKVRIMGPSVNPIPISIARCYRPTTSGRASRFRSSVLTVRQSDAKFERDTLKEDLPEGEDLNVTDVQGKLPCDLTGCEIGLTQAPYHADLNCLVNLKLIVMRPFDILNGQNPKRSIGTERSCHAVDDDDDRHANLK